MKKHITVGLYNLEPKIENYAMMKVSAYHKQLGDEVKIYNHITPNEYDVKYAFSLFDFTDKGMVTNDMICGGTGFVRERIISPYVIRSKLPKEIEVCDPDYSIFPECQRSFVRFSIGCFRNCCFCLVRQEEGFIKEKWEIALNSKGEYISILDNNFFGHKGWKKGMKWLKQQQQPMDFQGVDVRILNKEMCNWLNKFKHRKQIHIAWDNPKEDIRSQLKKTTNIIKSYKLMCYVLVGYNSTPKEDLYRINTLWNDFKIDPFVMPYNKHDQYQKDLARWCNKPQIRKTCGFEEYKDGRYKGSV